MLCSPSLSKGTAAEWSLISPSLTQAVPRDEPGFGAACEGRSLREPQKQLTHGSIPGKVCNSTQPGESASGGSGFWAGGAFVTNRLRSLFPEVLPCPAACLWRSGVVVVVLTPPQAPIHRAFPPAPALSSSIWPCPLSTFSIWADSTIPMLVFFITVCFVYPGQ